MTFRAFAAIALVSLTGAPLMAENRIDLMSNQTLEEAAPQLGRWELHFAPRAASWLLLLVGTLPLAFLGAVRRWWQHRAPRRKLQAQIERLTQSLGAEDAAAPGPLVAGLRRALGVGVALAWLGAWVAVAAGVIALELWGLQGG